MVKIYYKHSEEKGNHKFWDIRTTYYKSIFGFLIPYKIKFGESKEFLECKKNLIDSYN